MSLGSDIVRDAFEEIGLASDDDPCSDKMFDKGLLFLNSLLVTWRLHGVNLGTPTVLMEYHDLREPAGTRSGIVNNLALNLAMSYEVEVPDTLVANARRERREIDQRYGRSSAF